jgi:hypothetical protein
VSNDYLPPKHALGDREHQALVGLGWRPPEKRKDAEGKKKRCNYFRHFERPIDFDQVAALAVRTLRDVFQTPFPGRLEYDAFETGGGRIIVPTLELVRHRPVPREKPVPPLGRRRAGAPHRGGGGVSGATARRLVFLGRWRRRTG